MSQNNDDLLAQGIGAARRGDRNTGRQLLEQVLQQDPDNEKAWMWLASCMTTTDDRRKCLERVLEINPDNQRARDALVALGGTPEISQADIDRLRSAAVDSPASSSSSSRPAESRPTPEASSSGGGLQVLIIGFMVIVIIGGGVFLASLLLNTEADDETAPPTATPLPVVQAPTDVVPPTPSLPPAPTATVPIFSGNSLAPTLPPTFTPTPEPSPTPTGPPTATPFPQTDFLLLYTSLADGATSPDLYAMQGDGSDQRLLAEDVRDVAFDPTGELVAFVRNVTIVIDEETEETETYPQLFVGPVDNIDEAQPITDMRSQTIKSPSWSPEAQELVFVSDDDGDDELYTIQADGTAMRQLTDNDRIDNQPAWNPALGSRQVVFASDQGSFGSLEVYSLEVLDPAEPVIVERLTDAVASSYAPAWNANGTQITFISDRQGDPDVYIMTGAGDDQRLVTRDDSGAEDRNPQFSPNGEFIAFVSNRLDDRFQVYLITPAGDSLTRLTDNNQQAIALAYQPVLLFRLQE